MDTIFRAIATTDPSHSHSVVVKRVMVQRILEAKRQSSTTEEKTAVLALAIELLCQSPATQMAQEDVAEVIIEEYKLHHAQNFLVFFSVGFFEALLASAEVCLSSVKEVLEVLVEWISCSFVCRRRIL